MSSEIVVVGAGVIGLSCAAILAERGHQVTVIANHFPSDTPLPSYTSPWAGAHFRPFPSRSENDLREYKLTRKTLEHFKTLCQTDPESSVTFTEGVEYLEKPDEYYSEVAEGYSEGIEGFQILSKNELPEGVTFGAKYTCWVLNPPIYLQYLERKLTMKYGAKFVKSTLVSLKQVAQTYPAAVIINASGQGLQYEGGYDPLSYPIRGQTLLIRPPPGHPYEKKTVTHQASDGSWTFVIPRPFDGGVIVGGTKQPYDLLSTPRESDTQTLIKRAKVLYPELLIDGEFDIRKVNVGFRPARKGGIRIESEKVGNTKIIHAYGVGGMGYEVSYGVAETVADLLSRRPYGTYKL